jgi:hypothetical protein
MTVTDSRVDIAWRHGAVKIPIKSRQFNMIRPARHYARFLTYNTLHVALEMLIRFFIIIKAYLFKFKNIKQRHQGFINFIPYSILCDNDMFGVLYLEVSLVRGRKELDPKRDSYIQYRHSDRWQSSFSGLYDDYDHLNARRIRTSRRDPRNNDHRVVRLHHSHHASVQ